MVLSEVWEKALSGLSDEEREFLLANVSELSVCSLPPEFYVTESGYSNGLDRFFTVKVARRSAGRYAVSTGDRFCFDAAFVGEYESLPSERSDDFKERFRHDFLTALKLAEELSLRHIRWGRDGLTAADIIAAGQLP